MVRPQPISAYQRYAITIVLLFVVFTSGFYSTCPA
jgi:hypothetical protein